MFIPTGNEEYHGSHTLSSCTIGVLGRALQEWIRSSIMTVANILAVGPMYASGDDRADPYSICMSTLLLRDQRHRVCEGDHCTAVGKTE